MMPQKSYMRSAFTLVEIAIVLVIIGLMSAVVLQSSHVAHPDNCYAATQRQLADINAAVASYARAHNRYPLPAGRSRGVNDPYFGQEVTAGSPGTDPNNDYDDIDRLASGGYSTNPVLFGALPFQTLGLNEAYAADCWGNKFSYVITESMTAADALSNTSAVGGLTVKSGNLGASNTLLADAVYSVISHGANGVGGVTKNYAGVSHGWCSVDAAIDTEDCDLSNATIFSTTFNNGDDSGALFYDDLVIFGGVLNSNCNESSYTDRVWGDLDACTGTVTGPLTSGGTATSTSGTATGTATFVCRNGVVELDTSVSYTCDGCTYPAGGGPAVCEPATDCSTPTVITWNAAGETPGDPGPCSVTTTPMVDGDGFMDGGVVHANTAAGYTGTARLYCSGGVIGFWQGDCFAETVDCAGGTVYWNPSGEETSCMATLPNGATGDAQLVSSSNFMTGSATYKCLGGAWSLQPGSGCNFDSSQCAGTTLTWAGGACSASFPTTVDGNSAGPLSNVSPGYTGSATATCMSGIWSTPTGTCVSTGGDCVGETLTWGSHCQANFPPTTDGDSAAEANVIAHFTGTGTAECHSGTWTLPTGDCTGEVVTCPAMNFVSGSCKYFLSSGTYDYGTEIATMQSPNNFVPGYTGGSDIQCTPSGTWSALGTGCDPIPASSCPGGVLTWGNGCSAAFSSTADGGTDGPRNDWASGGADGSATAYCNNGAWEEPVGPCAKGYTFCGNTGGCSGGSFSATAEPVYCSSPGTCASMPSYQREWNCDGSGGSLETYTLNYCTDIPSF